MDYELKFDELFDRKFEGLDLSVKKRVFKKVVQLKTDPRKGKPLFNIVPNLHELYVGSYRVYYYVEHNMFMVHVLDYLHKDDQRRYLAWMKKNKKNYLGSVKNSD